MAYIDYLKKGFEILKLNKKVISKVSKDQEATKWGIVTTLLVYLLVSFILAFFITLFTLGFGILFAWIIILVMPILAIIALYLSVGVFYILAKLFGGKGTYMELFRPLALANMIYILSFVPMVNYLVSIWYIIVSVVAISETQKISTGKAVAVVLIPIILLIIIVAILMFAVGVYFLSHPRLTDMMLQ